MVVISGSLGDVMVWNARDVSSNPALGAIFPICVTPYDTDCLDHDSLQATWSMVVEPTLCILI